MPDSLRAGSSRADIQISQMRDYSRPPLQKRKNGAGRSIDNISAGLASS